jgi:hypothetical protein
MYIIVNTLHKGDNKEDDDDDDDNDDDKPQHTLQKVLTKVHNIQCGK